MKKKILVLSLIFVTSLSLLGCGKGTFDVKSKNNTTYITIPAEYNPSDELPILLEDYGFKYSDKDKEGAITYSISDSDYKEFLKQVKDSINKYVDDINNGDEYQTIESVKINKDFNTMTVTVDKDSYSGSTDELTINALALKIAHYQGYNGDEISVKIKYKNIGSDSVYDDVTIP